MKMVFFCFSVSRFFRIRVQGPGPGFRSSQKKGVLKKFRKLYRKIPVLESLFNKVPGLQPASFLKRDSNMCFPVKFAKVLRTPILKNICERLPLEVFYKKAVLKNFAIFTGRK